MQNVIRNVFVGTGVLILSVAIFFLISDDRELKQDVYDHALTLLGQQLLAVLPENAPAAEVTEKWERFSEQAMKGEMPPEHVERVAVSILNASNAEEKLSPEEVDMMLEFAITSPPVIDVSTAPNSAEGKHAPPPPPVPPERYHKLGEEIMTALQFNSQMKEHLKDEPQKSEILRQNFHYEFNDGLKIEIDSKLQKELSDKALKGELAVLRNKEIVEWRQNLSHELEELHQRREAQLDSLEARLHEQSLHLQGLNQIQTEELVKSLHKLHKLKAVDPITVEKIIAENMRELHLRLQELDQKKQIQQ